MRSWDFPSGCPEALFQNHGYLADLADRFPSHADKFHFAGSAVYMPVFEEKDFSAPTLKVFLASR